MDTDHSGLNKYAGSEDDLYKSLKTRYIVFELHHYLREPMHWFVTTIRILEDSRFSVYQANYCQWINATSILPL